MLNVPVVLILVKETYFKNESYCSTFDSAFVSSFNRAEDLATAMEARGYQGGEGRTKYRILHWHLRDTIVMFGFVLLTIGLFVLRT